MESFLDVDGGDVVGEQDDFVGVKLVLIFPKQIGRLDEAALEQATTKVPVPVKGR